VDIFVCKLKEVENDWICESGAIMTAPYSHKQQRGVLILQKE